MGLIKLKIGLFWQIIGKSAAYYPKLSKITGGVTAAILFYHLFQRRSQLNNPTDWIDITAEEIEEETGLSRTEQQLARKLLIERSLLKERAINGNSNSLELWPDIDALEQKLEDFWPEVSTINTVYTDSEITARSNSNGDAIATNNVISNLPTPTINNKNDLFFGQPRLQRSVIVKHPDYRFSGPWNSQAELAEFQRVLLEYAKEKGFYNPAEWVFKIVDGITKGIESPYWEEFRQGIPIGESQKVRREWEIEPGVPYPAFEEEIIQYYIHKGEPLELAVSKARTDLRNPMIAKDLWDGFLRKCDRIADEAIKAKNLGISNPYMPPSFTDKPQITKETVMNKLASVAPQFSLVSSSQDELKKLSLETDIIEERNSDIPSLAALQSAYKSTIGRSLIEKQIAAHPEWGYGIIEGEIVDLFPF